MGTSRSGAYQGVSRATVVQSDDKPKLQELEIRVRGGQHWTSVEHWLPFGMSMVPLPPDRNGAAEVLVGYIDGSPDHPVVIAVADRRHRPKDMKPGDVAHHDHRGQSTVFSEKGVTHRSPLTITHETVDGQGNVTSSVVQEPSGRVTIKNKGGSTIVMDGPNITTRPGAGGKHVMDGDVDVKGSVTASKTIAGQAVTSGGQAVRTV